MERGWRWCKRNPAVAALAATVTLVLILGAGVGTGLAVWALAEKTRADSKALLANEEAERADAETGKAQQALRQAEKDRDLAREAEKKKEEELRRAEWAVYRNQITLAHTEWQHGSAAAALDYLHACQWNLCGWEHRYLVTQFNKIPTLGGTQDLSAAWRSAPTANASSAAARTTR
jgi:predicted acyl esterase